MPPVFLLDGVEFAWETMTSMIIQCIPLLIMRTPLKAKKKEKNTYQIFMRWLNLRLASQGFCNRVGCAVCYWTVEWIQRREIVGSRSYSHALSANSHRWKLLGGFNVLYTKSGRLEGTVGSGLRVTQQLKRRDLIETDWDDDKIWVGSLMGFFENPSLESRLEWVRGLWRLWLKWDEFDVWGRTWCMYCIISKTLVKLHFCAHSDLKFSRGLFLWTLSFLSPDPLSPSKCDGNCIATSSYLRSSLTYSYVRTL